MNEEDIVVQAAPTVESEQEVKPKRSRKKLGIVLGVAAAVVAAAGAGFFVWHEQPSFCNAICHSPMDPYVEDYYDEGTDKLVGMHAKAGAACLDCHEPTLSQQVGEGLAWAAGDFSDPPESRSDTIGTREICFKCHDDGDPKTGVDWEDIVASTEAYGGEKLVNPHASHLGNSIDCGDCHSVHGAQTIMCNECHYIDLHESWEA